MSEQLSRAVSAEVRRLLDERGWSGRELARRTGIPVRSVGDKLADRSKFDVDDLDAICQAFDVEVTDLPSWAQRR